MGKKIRRRDFIKDSAKLGIGLSGMGTLSRQAMGSEPRKNVLFISVDDLNDWISPLGASDMHTPNFQRLARRSRVFQRAYANVTLCSPSRSATMFGMLPTNTGVYTNREEWQRNPILTKRASLPRFFKNHGYETFESGKIFHGEMKREAHDPSAWTHLNFHPDNYRTPTNGEVLSKTGKNSTFDFGPYGTVEGMADTRNTRWLIEKVFRGRRSQKPFFAALGIQKPHLRFIVPKRFFDLYDPDQIVFPHRLDYQSHLMKNNPDVKDLPAPAKRLIESFAIHGHYQKVIENKEWRSYIHAYKACISFADYCLGLLLDALDQSPYRDNTYIVLWSDHGYQLGEKLAMRKFTLWERASRVPLMIAGPGIEPGNTAMPVSLIDIYPTLADLVLSKRPGHLDGNSLKKHLLDRNQVPPGEGALSFANLKRDSDPHSLIPAVSLRWLNFRYIEYRNQRGQITGQEFYDHRQDPHELYNLYHASNRKRVDAFIRSKMEAMEARVPRHHEFRKPLG